MSKAERHEHDSVRGRRVYKYGLILLAFLAAGVGGVWTGNWLADRRAALEDKIRMDEYLGLGTRTGLTTDVGLLVDPLSLAVRPSREVKVNLTLVNRGRRTVKLNGWFTPAPAYFESNQLPFKVIVTRDGRSVPYRGNAALFPPHTKKDFVTLRPGERRLIPVDLSRGPGNGRWDLSAPGDYTLEVWYETYLTGRCVGVEALTGMTNHVIVKVTVRP
ncbi:MAG TPA: hypothetical protein VMX94_08430 [Armatimonadota bacterium]|nr:hypothetical protein [Armatimonadota bacterium]